MKPNIAYFTSKLFKNFLILSLLFFASSAGAKTLEQLKKYSIIELQLPNGSKVMTYVAKSNKQQNQGLSGLRDKNFKDNHAMLFYYKKDGPRNFWMPDTYFNLDIFFLDKDFKVLSVERDIPFHPGTQEPPRIYRTKTHYARHVLEMKSSSALAKSIGPKQSFKVIKGSSLLGKE
jgi:uncharacterized membrane protein (UPF0127 family)